MINFFDYLTAIDPKLTKSDFQMEDFINILRERRGLYGIAGLELGKGLVKGRKMVRN